MAKGKKKYRKELPRELYTYFIGQTDSVPSFSKFARQVGMTLEDLAAFREKGEFDKAWRDCIEIRRDYLIDAALTKRADPSFVKFLISDDDCRRLSDENGDGAISVTLTVED